MTERLTKIKYNGIVSRKHEETGVSCSTYCDSCSQGGGNCEYASEMIKKLAEYETAEEEGKLVVLPCKVGDTVWTFYDDMSDVVDFTVEKIQIVFDKDGDPYFLINGMDFEIDCLGKTLFFDCEDAKRELNKIKECYEL